MAGTAAYTNPVVHRPQGIKRIEVALTCTAGGVVDEAVIGEAYGRLVGILYDGGLDASATVTLKHKPGTQAAQTLFTHTTGVEGTPVFVRPARNIVDQAGTAVAAAATATDTWRDIFVAGKLTITVAGGGNAETGKYAFIIDETVPPPTMEPALTV